MAFFNGQKILNARVEMVGGGYEEGKTAEWNAFWDAYQQNGNRRNYAQAFYSVGWDKDAFKPKYDIVVTGNKVNMFGYSNIEQIDVVVDVSGATTGHQLFYYSQKLHTVSCLRVAATTPWASSDFAYCYALENITIEGEIGQSIDLHWSEKLTAASVYSIVDHLKQYPSDDAEFGTKTLTISRTAWDNFMQNGETPEGMLANHGSWENYLTNIGWQLVLA